MAIAQFKIVIAVKWPNLRLVDGISDAGKYNIKRPYIACDWGTKNFKVIINF